MTSARAKADYAEIEERILAHMSSPDWAGEASDMKVNAPSVYYTPTGRLVFGGKLMNNIVQYRNGYRRLRLQEALNRLLPPIEVSVSYSEYLRSSTTLQWREGNDKSARVQSHSDT